ncbi:hypothetical protein CoNPh35_CDS0016 [Staphylococcus phage S-CoN_Ph35]|nr:hypothetical protein CoNPh35_CDS0016 [Staphylococcus phage S-CoN_Ph35]
MKLKTNPIFRVKPLFYGINSTFLKLILNYKTKIFQIVLIVVF